MEGIRVNSELFNYSFLHHFGEYRRMNVERLLKLLSRLPESNPWLRIRFGDFAQTTCTCPHLERKKWPCRSGGEFHAFGFAPRQMSFFLSGAKAFLVGWPIAPNDPNHFPHTLYDFRCQVERYGFCEKCHNGTIGWRNDHFHISLGRLGDSSDEKREDLKDAMWEYLHTVGQKFVEVHASKLKIVLYEDEDFTKTQQPVPLRQAIQNPQVVKKMYGWIP